MIIAGEWFQCDDGIVRPTIRGWLVSAKGERIRAPLLVDLGADCTALVAPLLDLLSLPTRRTAGSVLHGVSGSSEFVVVTTALEMPRNDGGVVVVRGDFRAFTDPKATDMSVLGRDILDNFDVIASRRRNQVLLVAGSHGYTLTP